jgi:hypothetical protein
MKSAFAVLTVLSICCVFTVAGCNKKETPSPVVIAKDKPTPPKVEPDAPRLEPNSKPNPQEKVESKPEPKVEPKPELPAGEPVVDFPPAPTKGQIAIAAADSVNGDDPATCQIAYSTDDDWVGKKVHVAIKQVITVERQIQDRATLSTGTQTGTKTVTAFIPLTLKKQGRETISLPPCRSTGVDGTVNVISDQSIRSGVELVVVTSPENDKPLSNIVSPKTARPESQKTTTKPKLRPSVPVVKEQRRIDELKGFARKVQFYGGSRHVLSLAEGDDIRIWDTENGKEVGKLAGHRAGARTFIVLPDGKQALSCDSWTLYLWDIEKRTSRKIAGDNATTSFPVHTEAMSTGGDRVLMGQHHSAPAVWSLKQQKQEIELKESATYFTLAPDGKTALLVKQSDVSVWDIDRNTEIRKFPKHKSWASSPTFSPDSRRALTYDLGIPGIIYLWDVEAGKEIRRFQGHEDQIGVAIFSPDGRRILSGSGGRLDFQGFPRKGKDLTIRLWDAESGKEICWLEGHTGVIRTIAFSSDGRYVVSAADDATIRFWKLPEQ